MLSTGEELQEVDQSRTEFQTELPTIYCGNVGDGEFIVQVYVLLVFFFFGGTYFHPVFLETFCGYGLPLEGILLDMATVYIFSS